MFSLDQHRAHTVSGTSVTHEHPRQRGGRTRSRVRARKAFTTGGTLRILPRADGILCSDNGDFIPDLSGLLGFIMTISYGMNTTMSDSMTVFNRSVVRLHRDRASFMMSEHDFLLREVANRLLDRLDDVMRSFPLTLDLGARSGLLSEIIGPNNNRNKRNDIEHIISCELSEAMTRANSHNAGLNCVSDEEALPFGPETFNLVLSNLALHWVNDLPGTFIQIRKALKPDGLLLASMFGGDTLHELRSSLAEAEIAIEGGLSPRISPFADIRDIGGLLQRAGFALPVIDSETITVHYSDPIKLLYDLRGMGETNAVYEKRPNALRRETLMRALQIYRDKFGDDEGRVPATFNILNLSGWAPAPDQQQPLQRGTGQQSLTETFSTS